MLDQWSYFSSDTHVGEADSGMTMRQWVLVGGTTMVVEIGEVERDMYVADMSVVINVVKTFT